MRSPSSRLPVRSASWSASMNHDLSGWPVTNEASSQIDNVGGDYTDFHLAYRSVMNCDSANESSILETCSGHVVPKRS